MNLKDLKLCDPCPEEWMTMSNPKYSICEVLREIWQSVDDPQVKIRARIALTMAKKMNLKLIYYAKGGPGMEWIDDTAKMRKQIGELKSL